MSRAINHFSGTEPCSLRVPAPGRICQQLLDPVIVRDQPRTDAALVDGISRAQPREERIRICDDGAAAGMPGGHEPQHFLLETAMIGTTFHFTLRGLCPMV